LAAAALVTVPLITAMLGRAVVHEQLDGRAPRPRRVAEEGLDLFLPALLAWVVLAAGVGLGLFLLIVPGLYLLVSGYYVVAAVVVDNHRGFGALQASIDAVRGHWWYSAGVILSFQLLTAIFSEVVIGIFESLATAADSDALIVAGNVLADTLALPFTAIGFTLCYIELSRRRDFAAAA
ncbi:MAG TPA: hypothetical protein VL977_04895, partial [Solirubrobacteraceae bacterium]|nr:hypothetical protein [Solirubrobacteraceae bacterium]